MDTEKKNIIFPTAYLPPVSYFYEISKYRCIYIDRFENYIKQTYRNRCCIYSANGKLTLSIPVKKITGNHTLVRDIQIDYSEEWQRLHWRAIESAYSNSPFFLYYRNDFESFFLRKIKYLADLNHEMMMMICRHIGIKTEFIFSEEYFEKDSDITDYRDFFSPKKQSKSPHKKYKQVFDEKLGFICDLSIIDLLFNEGGYSIDYL